MRHSHITKEWEINKKDIYSHDSLQSHFFESKNIIINKMSIHLSFYTDSLRVVSELYRKPVL
jgi:hypothetical protein